MKKSITKTQAKNKAIELLNVFKINGYTTNMSQEEIEQIIIDSNGENFNIKVTKIGNRCKYCGEANNSEDEDVLCADCRQTFGHAFYSQL